MSVNNPAFVIARQSIAGMEGMFVKMWDPPTTSPATPDMVAPTNPVPEVMAAAGYQNVPKTPHTVMRDLMHGQRLDAWDGTRLNFFLFRDHDNPATGDGNFPGATIRVPRGSIFHAESQGHGPPPHTIHWHGVEPTPMNDGVGHCSMEIGHYTYQFQPNFVGFYFCHCHRNTVQHFEFGLYQAVIVDPPDAFFATQWNRAIPIGAGRDGLRRVAANLNIIGLETAPGSGQPHSGAGFENLVVRTDAEVQALFPGYVGGDLRDPDPQAGNLALPEFLRFQTNPHALTVPYDVEAVWVFDDRDSVWSDLADGARDTFPRHGDIPGVNDNFHGNAGGGVGPGDFFAFNDFNSDYFYVTGVNFPGPVFGTADLPEGIVIPPELMSGVSGVQVPINANVGQTVLLRLLNGAYNNIRIKLPVDATIIAWDGRALGGSPFGQYNHAYTVPANTPIHISVARRFDALIKADAPVSGFAEIEFIDTRCGTATGFETPVRFTGRIPINIGFGISGRVTNSEHGFGLRGVTVNLTGPVSRTAVTDSNGNYGFAGMPNGAYTVTPALAGFTFAPGNADVTVNGANVVVPDFSATAVAGLFSITGLLFESRGGAAIGATPGAQANPVATVTLATEAGVVIATVTPDSQGRFVFTGLPNGTYVVTPTSAAFNFRPTSRNVTVNGANRGATFRGTAVPVAPLA